MNKFSLFLLLSIAYGIQAGDPGTPPKEESKRCESNVHPKELVPGASLLKLCNTVEKELQQVADSEEPLFPVIKKNELLTLLQIAKASVMPLAQDKGTKKFMKECNIMAHKALKLQPELRDFLLTSYSNHKSAQAFMDLLIVLCFPDNEQSKQVIAEIMKEHTEKPVESSPKVAGKKGWKCVIL